MEFKNVSEPFFEFVREQNIRHANNFGFYLSIKKGFSAYFKATYFTISPLMKRNKVRL